MREEMFEVFEEMFRSAEYDFAFVLRYNLTEDEYIYKHARVRNHTLARTNWHTNTDTHAHMHKHARPRSCMHAHTHTIEQEGHLHMINYIAYVSLTKKIAKL